MLKPPIPKARIVYLAIECQGTVIQVQPEKAEVFISVSDAVLTVVCPICKNTHWFWNPSKPAGEA